MLSRRKALLAALWAGLLTFQRVFFGDAVAVAQDIADLKTQLNSGLKCRRNVEFEFIDLIVAKTQSGELSVELVKGTFQWARRKKPYPFPFFERAIRIRAADVGVEIP